MNANPIGVQRRHEEVAGAGLGQPAELVGPAREVEDGTLDLGDRRQGGRIGADRLGCQVGGLRVRARPAGEREVRESRDRVGGVVAGGGAHIGRRDDRAHLAAIEREGVLQQLPTDALRLPAGPDEQLGQLEEAASLDRAGVPDQLPAVGRLGNPPFGGVLGQEAVDRLDPLPPRVGIALQRRPVPAPEVGGRGPQQVVAGADVGRGSTTDDRGCALGHSATIQATSRATRAAAPPGLADRWDPCIIPPFATEPAGWSVPRPPNR